MKCNLFFRSIYLFSGFFKATLCFNDGYTYCIAYYAFATHHRKLYKNLTFYIPNDTSLCMPSYTAIMSNK